MEYYFYANDTWNDFDKLEPYIVKRYKKGTVAKIVFDDSRYNDFIKDYKISRQIKRYGSFSVLGDDGHFYSITLDCAVKGDKFASNFPKECIKYQSKTYKNCISDRKFKNKALSKSKYGNTEKISNGIFGFNKFQYINGEKNFIMPYRFKKAEKANQPLIVYLAGAGTIGHDNFKPLREFHFLSGKKVLRHDCNILIPQCMRAWEADDYESKIRDIVTDNCAELIKQIIKENDIDVNRIYIYGTSFGAGCVWQAIVNSPDLYAAVVEVMGEYINYENLTDTDFAKISHIPIWMAHSSDDKVVNIASDDYFYDNLKSLGSNVKYTRWDKYGHAMASRFYKKEPWVEWMFNQSK